ILSAGGPPGAWAPVLGHRPGAHRDSAAPIGCSGGMNDDPPATRAIPRSWPARRRPRPSPRRAYPRAGHAARRPPPPPPPPPRRPPFPFTPGNLDGRIGIASRPASAGPPPAFEIEAADDFLLTEETSLSSATFTGLLPTAAPSVQQVVVEIYRVFPKDSDVFR